MRIVAFLLLTIGADAQEVQDWGVISKRRAHIIEASTNRTDFAHFRIEVQMPHGKNAVLITTNSLLRIEDLHMLQEGPAILGISSICSDGEQSPIALVRVNVQRRSLAAPTGRPTALSDTNSPKKLSDAVMSKTESTLAAIESPPMPDSLPAVGGPAKMSMESGNSKSYSEHLKDMKDWYEMHGLKNRTGLKGPR